jgi:dephospho-CoA kinase
VIKIKVIGITGPTGSGKTTAARYLYDKYGFEVLSIGDAVREEVLEQGKELTAKNLDEVATSMVKKKGESYWIKKLIDRISGIKCEVIVVDGIRRKFEVQFLKTKFDHGIFLVLIQSLPEVRFKRMKKSDEPDDPKTVEEFVENEKRKNQIFHKKELLPFIECEIENNGSLEEFYSQLDEMVAKLKLR